VQVVVVAVKGFRVKSEGRGICKQKQGEDGRDNVIDLFGLGLGLGFGVYRDRVLPGLYLSSLDRTSSFLPTSWCYVSIQWVLGLRCKLDLSTTLNIYYCIS
jgi:hypothetical protein